MVPPKQYRAKAIEFGGLIEASITSNERREYQQLQRKFAELADNEQWVADNHEQTLHAADNEQATATVLAEHERSINSSKSTLPAGRGEDQ
jgi:rubrerythrin